MTMRVTWIAMALFGALVAGCGGGTEGGGTATGGTSGGTGGDASGDASGAGGPQLAVYTSCFPVHYLTERVAGDQAKVTLILPAGEAPPEWTPPADTVAAMQQADLIVLNGAGFEGWLGTTTLPESKLVDASAGLKERLIELEETTHSHGKGGEHSHKGVDPHTWSDPDMAVAQADAIHRALAQADPERADGYRRNFEALRDDLTRLDQDLKVAVEGYGGEELATSHPAFNYLARRYGLKVSNFGFEPDEMPGDEAFASFTHEVDHHGLKRMLWEAEPTDEVRARFEGAGVEVLFLDPLEQPQGDAAYDYIAQARANAERLRAMFPVQGAEPAGAGG